ncbi:hypothetical protein HaLaN_03582, partial [Haematococcus lacustris]
MPAQATADTPQLLTVDCSSGCTNMGLVIFMQVLTAKCALFGSAYRTSTCALMPIYWQAVRSFLRVRPCRRKRPRTHLSCSLSVVSEDRRWATSKETLQQTRRIVWE